MIILVIEKIFIYLFFSCFSKKETLGIKMYVSYGGNIGVVGGVHVFLAFVLF